MLLRALTVACILLVSAGAAQTQSQLSSDASKVLRDRFGDWTHRCVRPDDKPAAAPACELAQSVRVKRDGKLLDVISLAVSRARDKAGQIDWALVVVTPLDVHLPSQFGIAVGKTTLATVQYRNCNRFGCWAVVPLSAAIIQQFQAEDEAAALFRVLDGKTVRIVFSLKGFTKGFRALTSGKLPSNT